MTFLEIAQKVARESGITTNGPATVIGQQGGLGKVISWVLDSILDVINESNHWEFMWAEATSTTVVGKSKYLLGDLNASDLKHTDTFRVGGVTLTYTPWEMWKDTGRFRSLSPLVPYQYTINPAREVILFPTPQTPMVIELEYYKRAVLPVQSTDQIIIPIEYQPIIVQKALMYYSVHEDDVGRYQQTQIEYERWLGLLFRDYTPQVSFR